MKKLGKFTVTSTELFSTRAAPRAMSDNVPDDEAKQDRLRRRRERDRLRRERETPEEKDAIRPLNSHDFIVRHTISALISRPFVISRFLTI